MQASGTKVWLALLLTAAMASFVAPAPASARDKHKHKAEKPVEEEKPAEPEAEGGGWDQSAESIGKKPKSKAKQDVSPEAAADSSSDSGETKPESESNENVAAIDAASETAAKDEAVASKEPPSWWLGAYLHGVWVPGFMLGLFLQDPPTIANPAFGLTATHRSKDGFSLVMGLGYVGYSFTGGMHEKGKPDVDTEYVQSTLGVVHLTGAMLWSSQLVQDTLSVEYGFGLDFGFITGKLMRTEGYPDGKGGYLPCDRAGFPDTTYCEATVSGGPTDSYNQQGAQYHVKEQRIPPVIVLPMLPLLTLRYTPVRNVAVKLEAAYGVFQFMFGISAAYGLDI